MIIAQYDNDDSKKSAESKLKLASAGISLGLMLLNGAQFFTTAFKIKDWST